ncbi:MAG TPA: ribonuclease J [Candidatus Paceibacterota bacterium]|nr:ribonuclease J [Candidatus Pacearchaeota archaeon]HPZ74461.1 ribonuclease J [Candidatus Pacearchaeota archaeon]HQD89010.1 ribonuclease J [Candidatus Pacearchaeota archaeon]HRR39189.1 ribonuclease J [Candidatus Paceibacterota bacterium]
MQNKLKIIPLGGLEEVGKNMTLFEYEGKILIVDMGIQFPDTDMPGVDYIIPNYSYLEKRTKDILGIVFTHGHYDHIGAIPYMINQIGNPPLFATKLAKGLILKRQEDFSNLAPLNIKEIKREEKISLPPFSIETFPQNHNIPDGIGLLIETPVGRVLHTGDFKFDFTPVADIPTDVSKIASLASKDILLLMSDSTNAEVPGHSLSEKTIQENLGVIFEKSRGRIIAATFASLLSRIQELINLAEIFGRKIIIEGYSMKANVEIAIKLGFLKVKKDTIISPKQLRRLPDNKILIICTGSQGEGDAVLMRLAHKDHRFLSIKRGDSVILSSSIVPGNEKAIQDMKDLLAWQGAKIFHSQMMDIHASGHAQKEELKMMINLTKPKFFMPIHGSYYMREMHKELAMSLNVPEKNIVIGENGSIIELSQEKFEVQKEKAPSTYVMVDGLGIGDVGEIVIRDRQAMAKDGMFVIVIVVDSATGRVKQSPDIISRGFVYLRESKELLRKTRQRVIKLVEKITSSQHPANMAFVKKRIREDLGEFLFKETNRRPMVLPVVIEV